MGALTPQILMDLESRMQVATENDYAAFAENSWWEGVMRKRPTGARREIIAWLLSTAQIDDVGPMGGKINYDEILAKTTEYETGFANRGLKLPKSQLEDTDGQGVDLAVKWSSDIGAYMGYWPQKQAAKLLMNGHLSADPTTGKSILAYDGVPFFSASHLLHPADSSVGIFANLFTGSAAGTPYQAGANPGAFPIDDTQTIDVALSNLSKIVSYIRGVKMPNGVDPRYLRPRAFIAPPRMQQRIVQLTNAKFIAQAAAGGGAGSADVEQLIASFGFVQPIVADELAGFESDTTCFLVCDQLQKSQLGGLVYIEREAFAINYYTGAQLPDLNRMNELEWQVQGRYAAGYGHPFTIFKIKGS